MFRDEGYKFMAAAFEVYNQLGYGLAEEIYQQSLEIELTLREIPFYAKKDVEVFYKNHQLTTRYRPDLVVFNGIVVEVKAVASLLPEHEAQIFNYLRITKHAVGYLVNFGFKGQLQWKRIIVTDHRNWNAGLELEH